MQGGFSLRKKPLDFRVSVKSRIENAVTRLTEDQRGDRRSGVDGLLAIFALRSVLISGRFFRKD
jgi:hypothetical protein